MILRSPPSATTASPSSQQAFEPDIMSSRVNQRRYHSDNRLRLLIEQIVADECRLSARGLAFLVDVVEVFGRPPERLRVWGTLHFLPLGSPFCCCEPQCHLGLFSDRLERVEETLRHRLHLQQEVPLRQTGLESTMAHFDHTASIPSTF